MKPEDMCHQHEIATLQSFRESTGSAVMLLFFRTGHTQITTARLYDIAHRKFAREPLLL